MRKIFFFNFSVKLSEDAVKMSRKKRSVYTTQNNTKQNTEAEEVTIMRSCQSARYFAGCAASIFVHAKEGSSLTFKNTG